MAIHKTEWNTRQSRLVSQYLLYLTGFRRNDDGNFEITITHENIGKANATMLILQNLHGFAMPLFEMGSKIILEYEEEAIDDLLLLIAETGLESCLIHNGE